MYMVYLSVMKNKKIREETVTGHNISESYKFYSAVQGKAVEISIAW